MVVALTGGIGSGKSFICKKLLSRGIEVYDCDRAAKRLLREDRELQRKINDVVGECVFHDGQMNKARLATYITASKENATRIDEIVHPAVASDFLSSSMEWIESAILFESGFDERIHPDYVVCVSAPIDVRLQRVMVRDSITCEKAMEWIDLQLSQEEKEKRSDFVIINDGVADVDEQIDTIINKINYTNQIL